MRQVRPNWKENTLKSERESSRSNRAEPVGPVGGVLKGLLDTNCKRKLEELELLADVGYFKKIKQEEVSEAFIVVAIMMSLQN